MKCYNIVIKSVLFKLTTIEYLLLGRTIQSLLIRKFTELFSIKNVSTLTPNKYIVLPPYL